MTGPFEGLRLCPACGTVAPTERPSCSQCSGSLAQPLVMPASESALHCARVVVEMSCGACGFFFPIDGLPDDDTVECAHCDLHQAVGAERWTAFVRTAHEIGDLAVSHESRIVHACPRPAVPIELRVSDPMTTLALESADSVWIP